jgi:hypothetical protein
MVSTMFLHTVLFWLKPDLADTEIRTFEAGLRQLLTIPSVRLHFLGTPAATDRPVIDRSYSYKLVVGFDDRAGHDAYQDIDIHQNFITNCAQFWTKVLIYDADELIVRN